MQPRWRIRRVVILCFCIPSFPPGRLASGFDGVRRGTPIVVHKYDDGPGSPAPRAFALAPMHHFFVSGQAAVGTGRTDAPDDVDLQCGILSSVQSLPKGFNHSSVVLGGHGINGTLWRLGDLLLQLGGRERTDAYEDFVLSHLVCQ